METVILLFYFNFILIFGILAGWDAFITAMLSDRSSAEDVCRVGGEKKNLLSGSLCSTFGFLSSHIHARSGALMLPLSGSDPTSCGRPQTATIWCGLFFFGRGGASFSVCQLLLTQAQSCSFSMQSVTLLTPAGALGSNKVPPLLSSAIRLDALLVVVGGLPVRQLSAIQ